MATSRNDTCQDTSGHRALDEEILIMAKGEPTTDSPVSN